jgi:multiple sugar transport system permease protein/cellobiose transport system permease protein
VKRRWNAGIAIGAVLLVASALSIFPFYLMFSMSTFKSELLFQGLPLLPSNYLAENLKTVFASNFLTSYGNSVIVSAASMAVSALVSAMVGYAMNAYEFRLKKALRTFILLTMMVPSQIGVIGYMIEMRNVGLNNTLLPMILIWCANGFGAYWMISFIEGALPLAIVESARIEGANEVQIFVRIVIPCIRAGLVTLFLLIFLWSWNAYLVPLVFTNNKAMYTIPIFIKSLASAYRTDYGAQLTGLSIATIPMLILFIVTSRNFIRGLTAGAVKS